MPNFDFELPDVELAPIQPRVQIAGEVCTACEG